MPTSNFQLNRKLARLLFLTLFLLSIESAAWPQGIFDPAVLTILTDGQSGDVGSTTVTSSATTIVSSGSHNVKLGDIVYFTGNARFDKGGTNGLTSLYIEKDSGTATLFPTEFRHDLDHTAATNRWVNISGVFTITAPGTISVRLAATSAGSDATILQLNKKFTMATFTNR